MEKANQAFMAGRLDEAERLCRETIRLCEDSVPARLMLGIVAVKQERFASAISDLEWVVRNDSSDPYAPLWLSRAYRRTQRSTEALEMARRAVDLSPTDASAHYQLGLCYLDVTRFEDARGAMKRALEGNINKAAAYTGLGLALQGLKMSADASVAFRKAVSLAPTSLPALLGLWQASVDLNQGSSAVDYAQRILKLQGNTAEASLRVAQSLLLDEKPREAETYARQALSVEPNSGTASNVLGMALSRLGQIEAAETEFRRSIEQMPVQSAAYSSLIHGKKVREPDLPIVETMRELLGANLLSTSQKSEICYALGKSFEDLGQYEPAMRYFDEANLFASSAKNGHHTFDRELYAARIEAMISSFDSRQIERDEKAHDSSLPIFVVGMIRSGTTLVEGILSAHPEVGSAGEQGFWLDHRGEAFSRSTRAPDGVVLRSLAERYIEGLEALSPGSSRIVDKMPDNYLELPILHLALPKAKIVHVRRNPIDTCISIYTTMNRLGIDWIHNKSDIAFVYRQYRKIMRHWESILPEDAILSVDYEELVTNRERVTREMISFCELEWDERCMRPEDNRRTVSTPSLWQVRQPVYATSVDRWRRYEPWLGAFNELRDLA